MPKFNCEICDYHTNDRSNFNKHAKCRKHLKKVEKNEKLPQMTTNDHKMTTNDHKMTTNDHKMTTKLLKSFRCEYCDKIFTTKAHKRRHENHYCNYKFKNNLELKIEKMAKKQNKIEQKHEQEKQQLYKQIEMLIEKAGDTTTNYTTTNTANANIQLNSFGKENKSYITAGMLDNMIKFPMTMIPMMIEQTHFHKEHPENKNIKITNKKDKFIEVYDGKKWRYDNKLKTIRNLVDDNYDILDIYYDEQGRAKMARYERKRYDNFQKEYEEKVPSLVNKLANDVEVSILNHSKDN
jgi:hypothetical protein